MILLRLGLFCLCLLTLSTASSAQAKTSFDVQIAGHITNSQASSAVAIQGSASDPLFDDQWHLDRLETTQRAKIKEALGGEGTHGAGSYNTYGSIVSREIDP